MDTGWHEHWIGTPSFMKRKCIERNNIMKTFNSIWVSCSFMVSPQNSLRTCMSYSPLLFAEVSSCVGRCCWGLPPISLSTFTDLIVAWPSFFLNLAWGKGVLAHLNGEGGDPFNERKAITFQTVIIRLSYHMCDDPFFSLGRLFKCRGGSLLRLLWPDFFFPQVLFLQK